MPLALYTLTSAVLLYAVHKCIRPLSKPAALILYLVPFTFVGYALLAGRVYGPVDLPYLAPPLNWMKLQFGISKLHNGLLSDVYCQMIPWRKAVQWSIQHGEWPLWNRFILSGDILAAAGQPAPYSPFTLLAILLPVAQSLTFSAAITHFIAAAGAFLLARELGCREGAALIAAAGFTFSTAVALFILWPLGVAWSWFPFVLTGVHRQSIPLLTLGFTFLLLSGHPETALHVVFLAGLYCLVRHTFRAPIIAGVLSLLLTAIFVLPILEAAPQTMEHDYRRNVFAKQPRGVEGQETLARLATDLFPYAHARGWHLDPPRHLPPDSAAAGSLILALAIYAVWRVRSRDTWFFGAIALFCLLARAEWKPLARTLQHLPLFDITLNERFSFGAACALAILAALGVERMLQSKDRAAAITMAVVLIAITIGNYLIVDLVSNTDLGWGDYKIFAEIAFLAAATLLVAWRPHAALLLGLVLAQRVISDGGLYRTFDPSVAYPKIPILEPAKTAAKPFRITGHGVSFVPGTNALYELEDVRGYEAMTFWRYANTYRLFAVHQPVWFNRVDDLTKPFLSFLNVKYAITWDREPEREGWVEVARQRGSVLLENKRVLDRAFVPNIVRLGLSDEESLIEMESETDFRERAWILASLEKHQRTNGPGAVTNFQDANLGYTFHAEMQQPGWVVISVPAWEGWRAYVDGKRVKMQIANHAFLSVYLERGRHDVRLKYWPRGFVVGRAISGVTLLMVAGFVAWRRLKGSKAQRLKGGSLLL